MVVLSKWLPLEPTFRWFIFLQTSHWVHFSLIRESFIGYFLTIFFFMYFFMVCIHKISCHCWDSTFAWILLTTKYRRFVLSSSYWCPSSLIGNIGDTWRCPYMRVSTMPSWSFSKRLPIIVRVTCWHPKLICYILSTFIDFWSG